MIYTGKKFSVLGDSISTFKGITLDDPNTFYGQVMCRKGGFSGAEDTWWMRVINGLGGVFEKDNAFAGSCVTDGYGLGRGMSTEERTGALGSPDVILIFAGANDLGFHVPADEFRAAYERMLSRLREKHPDAEIWCSTLMNGRKVLDDEPFFMGEEPSKELEPFSGIIRECAAAAGAHLVDTAASGVVYDAIDGCHPTAHGMAQIAALWLSEMQKAL